MNKIGKTYRNNDTNDLRMTFHNKEVKNCHEKLPNKRFLSLLLKDLNFSKLNFSNFNFY